MKLRNHFLDARRRQLGEVGVIAQETLQMAHALDGTAAVSCRVSAAPARMCQRGDRCQRVVQLADDAITFFQVRTSRRRSRP